VDRHTDAIKNDTCFAHLKVNFVLPYVILFLPVDYLLRTLSCMYYFTDNETGTYSSVREAREEGWCIGKSLDWWRFYWNCGLIADRNVDDPHTCGWKRLYDYELSCVSLPRLLAEVMYGFTRCLTVVLDAPVSGHYVAVGLTFGAVNLYTEPVC